MLLSRIIMPILGLLISLCAHAQDIAGDTSANRVSISSKYLEQLTSKAGRLEGKIDRYSEKSLQRMQRQEARIQRKLGKIDSSKAKAIFQQSQQAYQQLDQKLKDKTAKLKTYIPSLDTLNTSLKFLGQNENLLSSVKDAKGKLDGAMKQVNDLQSKFQQAENIKQFLKERRQYLRDQLQNLGFAKELKKINKQAYYYSQQLNEYKEILKDHRKAEKKAIELLSKTKFFKDFMRKNSELASLFRPPLDPNDPNAAASLAGLQTRSQVNNLIQQRIAAGGPNAQQQFQQNVQQAQSELTSLKNKLLKAGAGSSDDIMPEGFKPNEQKTKSFLQRLEYGANMQSQRANAWWPVTSDIGFTLGYKLNDKSVIGIGASYKMGWGQNIRNVKVTNQGRSWRSFIDWKIKGSFWVSGGYELNYRPLPKDGSVLINPQILKSRYESGLIGISKQVSLKSKMLKKTKLQLLWDFLSYQQVPRTQAILFRVGYGFN